MKTIKHHCSRDRCKGIANPIDRLPCKDAGETYSGEVEKVSFLKIWLDMQNSKEERFTSSNDKNRQAQKRNAASWQK